LNRLLAWFITFNFVNIGWVFFRATTWDDALKVLKGMFGLNGVILPKYFSEELTILGRLIIGIPEFYLGNISLMKSIIAIVIGLLISVFIKNSIQITDNLKLSLFSLIFTLFLFLFSVMSLTKISEFLYFNF